MNLRAQIEGLIRELQQENKKFVQHQRETDDLISQLGQLWNESRNNAQQGIMDSLKTIADQYRSAGESVWKAKERLEQVASRL